MSEFGQTPVQIFEDPHPVRKARILRLEPGVSHEDNKTINAKNLALVEDNERLMEEL